MLGERSDQRGLWPPPASGPVVPGPGGPRYVLRPAGRASVAPTPSCFGTPVGALAPPPPRSGPRPQSTPGADTAACPPALCPWVPRAPETPQPGSWRSCPTPRSTAWPLPPTSPPAWEIAAVQHPHPLGILQSRTQILLQPVYDRVVVPRRLGEKPL